MTKWVYVKEQAPKVLQAFALPKVQACWYKAYSSSKKHPRNPKNLHRRSFRWQVKNHYELVVRTSMISVSMTMISISLTIPAAVSENLLSLFAKASLKHSNLTSVIGTIFAPM